MFVAGIDHGFSFPHNCFERYGLKSWPDFLDDSANTGPPTVSTPMSISSVKETNALQIVRDRTKTLG